ncbi:hypothetical protein MOQ_001323 [Trypanosoma cruzi marinkellei]|uniref:Uncharacterized protein n=1 Tax=Trypanosoma cruzi marinkellei TaxID=85056 RepID=K2NGI4_TRYCR|nr:hypothetical protein MOQ_001323 [Trypanosoma cruzi marinkellei]
MTPHRCCCCCCSFCLVCFFFFYSTVVAVCVRVLCGHPSYSHDQPVNEKRVDGIGEERRRERAKGKEGGPLNRVLVVKGKKDGAWARMDSLPGHKTQQMQGNDALLFVRKTLHEDDDVSSSASDAWNSEAGSNFSKKRLLQAKGSGQGRRNHHEEAEGKDPCREIVTNAAEIRRRVHRANVITSRLRDSSGKMMQRLRQKKGFIAINGHDDDESLVREALYCEFRTEFAAALETMRSLHFFGALTVRERIEIPVTRAAFIASRKNMIGIQKNQQSLLYRQLFTAWQQHYRLCRDMLRRQRDIGGCRTNTSLFIGRGDSETSSSWEKTAGGVVSSSLADNAEEGNSDFKKLQDHMNTLHALLWDMQRIAAKQRELLQQLEGNPIGRDSGRWRRTAQIAADKPCCGKNSMCGCCTIM